MKYKAIMDCGTDIFVKEFDRYSDAEAYLATQYGALSDHDKSKYICYIKEKGVYFDPFSTKKTPVGRTLYAHDIPLYNSADNTIIVKFDLSDSDRRFKAAYRLPQGFDPMDDYIYNYIDSDNVISVTEMGVENDIDYKDCTILHVW